MSGTLYTSWKDSLGGSHIDEAVAIYENGKIYVAVDGFLGTIKKGVLIGEYEDGKVYSIGTGAFNYGKRLNLVAIIENGKIYSVQRSILGGISKSLSVGDCSNGKVYSHSHKLIEGQESFGLYNGDEEGAAAAAAIALFKLKSDVSAYYDKSQEQDSSLNDDDLWEKYGLLMPIVVTYRIFKYMFVACRWIFKAIVWLVSSITNSIQEQKKNKENDKKASEEQECFSNVSEIRLEESKTFAEDRIINEDIIEVDHVKEINEMSTTDEIEQDVEIKEDSDSHLCIRRKNKHMRKFIIISVCIVILTFVIFFSAILNINPERNYKGLTKALYDADIQVYDEYDNIVITDEYIKEVKVEECISSDVLLYEVDLVLNKEGRDLYYQKTLKSDKMKIVINDYPVATVLGEFGVRNGIINIIPGITQADMNKALNLFSEENEENSLSNKVVRAEIKTDWNILSEMDSSELREVNIFLSNFSETYYDPSSVFFGDAEGKIQFAYLHALINSYSLTFYENGYMGISATDVNNILKRFFGSTVPRETPRNSQFWIYENGKFIMPAASGESYADFSIATKMIKRPDGNFDVTFNIYADPSAYGGNSISDKTIYSLTDSEAATKYKYRGSGNAVLKAKMHKGSDTYELVSYTVEYN